MDIGENEPLNIQYPEKVKELKTLLDAWLIETSAKILAADPEYNPLQKTKVKLGWRTSILQKQEQLRKQMLAPDWKPNQDWWGNMVTVDWAFFKFSGMKFL